MVIAYIVAGALLYSGGYAPISMWFLPAIGIAFFVAALQKESLLRRLFYISLFGFIANGIVLHWTSTYVGAGPWLLLTILETAFLLPLALIFPLQKWRYFAFPSAWVLMEFFESRFPFGGFGWTRIGFSQADSPYKSIASVAGVAGLSFVTILLALIFHLLTRKKYRDSLAIFGCTSLTVLISTALLPMQGPRTINVLAIQGGVPKLGLEFNARAEQVFHNHLDETYRALKSGKVKPDLIVWPENAVDVDPFANADVRKAIDALVTNQNIPIILGAVKTFGSHYQNVSILWEPHTGPSSIYIKNHLTPFGEYIPLRSWAKNFSPLVNDVTDFSPGREIQIHRIAGVRVGPVICFDLIDDQLLRNTAITADILAVQTNNATFGTSPQSKQQLAIARVRAIEHQKSIVSISTSGVSAFIDNLGNIEQETDLNTSAAIAAKVSLQNGNSISDKLGNRAEAALVFIPTLLWFIVRRMRKI